MDITPENFNEYCLAKLGEQDGEITYSILKKDEKVLNSVIEFIQSKSNLENTLGYINSNLQNKTFNEFCRLKGGHGTGVENMGRGEIL